MMPLPFNQSKWLLPLFALLLFSLAVFFFFQPEKPGVPSNASCSTPLRESYSVSPLIFQNLPPFPRCFFPVVREYQSNRFSDDYFFAPEYYLQPEFFPYFFPHGLSAWQNPSSTHYGAVGFGAFPQTKTISLAPAESASIRFFVHSGFGVHAYQGMRLESQTIPVQNQLELTLDPISRDGFLLAPTFPAFSREWVHPVDVNIFIPPSTPPGEYVVHFVSAPPASEVNSRWSLPPALLYFDATQFVGERSVFTLTVRVE